MCFPLLKQVVGLWSCEGFVFILGLPSGLGRGVLDTDYSRLPSYTILPLQSVGICWVLEDVCPGATKLAIKKHTHTYHTEKKVKTFQFLWRILIGFILLVNANLQIRCTRLFKSLVSQCLAMLCPLSCSWSQAPAIFKALLIVRFQYYAITPFPNPRLSLLKSFYEQLDGESNRQMRDSLILSRNFMQMHVIHESHQSHLGPVSLFNAPRSFQPAPHRSSWPNIPKRNLFMFTLAIHLIISAVACPISNMLPAALRTHNCQA